MVGGWQVNPHHRDQVTVVLARAAGGQQPQLPCALHGRGPVTDLELGVDAADALVVSTATEFTLDDIDLPNRRLTIAGHRQPLGELTHNAVMAWLEYRRATWPDIADRHVLISRISF
jgi:hypothetical protein